MSATHRRFGAGASKQRASRLFAVQTDRVTVLAGVTNARSESLNSIAKLKARCAYGFRNPVSQRRRVCTACTGGTRRRQRHSSSRYEQ